MKKNKKRVYYSKSKLHFNTVFPFIHIKRGFWAIDAIPGEKLQDCIKEIKEKGGGIIYLKKGIYE